MLFCSLVNIWDQTNGRLPFGFRSGSDSCRILDGKGISLPAVCLSHHVLLCGSLTSLSSLVARVFWVLCLPA